ncbi:unnamed protein product [Rodentolepis nana]|uniref:Biogenesis of lysosome-related organelles complex 1 subunit 1 n=1 Tax=Rodentolepis nana TaxID=102285 RepID=A0A0R3TCB4_RODNA|nr:unnamed protein product [Rodentolepis nana]
MKFLPTKFAMKDLNLLLSFREHFGGFLIQLNSSNILPFCLRIEFLTNFTFLLAMEETTDCSKQYEVFKTDIENRTHDLMDHLESSRGSFWQNLQACREYVIGQIDRLFTELEKQVLNEQKEIDDKAQEFGMEIMSLFDKIGSCVSTIGSCKKTLQTLSTGGRANED